MTTFAGLRRQAGRLWRAVRKERPVPLADLGPYADEEVLTMLRLLGVAMVETGQPTNLVEADLRAISKVYTGHELRALVFPTYLIVQLDGALATKTQIDEPSRATAQLDQAGSIDTLVQLAKARAVTPPQVIAQVRAVRSWPPRFGPALTVVGHMILTLGFGLALQPTLPGLPAYALLGGIVGLVLLIGRWLPSANTVLPPLAAIIATVLTTWYLAGAAGDGLLRVLAPALISVLPGMTLAIGAVELTSIQVISGSARLMYGAAQLLLLAFGVVVGARIAGPIASLHPNAQLGPWAPYLGTVVAALGFSLYKSAPRGALAPIAATMLVALVGQQLGGRYVDPMLAGFFGALVTVPFAQIIARFKGVPPAMVLMLAAFWFLVPGALSFVSVGEVVTTGTGGARALLSAVLAVFSIALGMLFGWGLDYAAAGLVDRVRHRREHGPAGPAL